MRAHKAPQLYQRSPGGPWWCYWRDERWSTKSRDRAEAERRVAARYRPDPAAPAEKGLRDACDLLHQALARRGRTDATRDIAVQKLGHFRRLWGDDRPLSTIDYALLSEYFRVRLEVDKVVRLTVSGELGYLRQAWKLARAVGWAPRPWDEIMPERFDRKYKPRTRWLTAREVELVLANLDEDARALVAWIIATGSDVGDVWRAQKGDIDWGRGLVRVRGTKNVFRDRRVPITAVTRPLLKLAAEHGPPFRRWDGLGQCLRKLAHRLGLPHFCPKDLRRTHGMWLRGAGVDPHLIGRVLGHADPEMAARVYATGEDEQIARLVRRAVRMRPGQRGRRLQKTRRRASAS